MINYTLWACIVEYIESRHKANSSHFNSLLQLFAGFGSHTLEDKYSHWTSGALHFLQSSLGAVQLSEVDQWILMNHYLWTYLKSPSYSVLLCTAGEMLECGSHSLLLYCAFSSHDTFLVDIYIGLSLTPFIPASSDWIQGLLDSDAATRLFY